MDRPDSVTAPVLRCPHCSETNPQAITTWRTQHYCTVCGKTWPRVVEKDVSGVLIDAD